jgi:hypothetical protein
VKSGQLPFPGWLRHRLSRSLAVALACVLAAGTACATERMACRVADYGKADAARVEQFVADFTRPTAPDSLLSSPQKRIQILDERLRSAGLSLADKIAVLQKLSPREDPTDERKELRMTRLILSVDPQDLPLFKLALEYDGDYKDLEEYVFHDIDNPAYRGSILAHLRKAPRLAGIKVLSDVDDTLYANLLDRRYPPKNLYPGVLAFYDALKQEPFNALSTPVTFLSARPNPIAGKLEEDSLQRLMALTGGKLCPSALSGRLRSSVAGTLQSIVRDKLDDSLHDSVPDGKEQEIARVKFRNFLKFADLYPEYRHVFVGDSGQADALTARLMLDAADPARVITTFIHDIARSSRSFNALRADDRITRVSANGRGIIVFRNYIDAAIIAHRHSKTLGDLITADKLAGITRAALSEFQAIKFNGDTPALTRLRHEYRQDAEEAYRLLATASRTSSPDVAAIRSLLDQGF